MGREGNCKVCVTGGAGYIGSALIHLLLQNGYTVHATLRNLGDESKVGLLKSFPCAEERLHLFEADIYKPEEFEKAIHECVFVFHVATPMQHTSGYKYNNTVEAAVNAVKKIIDACIQSGTVKRLIYTASVVAASPLKDDESGYKVTMDESCWTPLHLDVPYENEQLKDYTDSKTKSEQEILKFGEEKANELEVVTLGCGLVGGGGCLPYPTTSVLLFISQIANNSTYYQSLRYLEELLGKIPIVHIEDVCRAHIFCAEMPSINGRFLCASSYVTTAEIAKFYQKTYPELNKECLEEHGRETKWGSKKLEDKGFTYNYSIETILNDCLECAMRSDVI
ncbi:putative anthocyanidin reductase ((2R,3R)-flavan-3-ol-forming) [Helianthus annuus]|nr:putative anthocyanidin reductase ((2R,3R)-flavan-3-ol-forming) [Helianthus annuus]